MSLWNLCRDFYGNFILYSTTYNQILLYRIYAPCRRLVKHLRSARIRFSVSNLCDDRDFHIILRVVSAILSPTRDPSTNQLECKQRRVPQTASKRIVRRRVPKAGGGRLARVLRVRRRYFGNGITL